MAIYEEFKSLVKELKIKIEEFKDDHKMTSIVISKTIEAMPSPFNQLVSMMWEGFEKEENSTTKLLEILEKIEKNDEKTFFEILQKIQTLIDNNASHKDFQEISKQILTSQESIQSILETQFRKIQSQLESNRKSNEDKVRGGYHQLLNSLEPMSSLIRFIDAGLNLQTKEIPVKEFIDSKNSHLENIERITNQHAHVFDEGIVFSINQLILHVKNFPDLENPRNKTQGDQIIKNIELLNSSIIKKMNLKFS